jgi:hypothetical protein
MLHGTSSHGIDPHPSYDAFPDLLPRLIAHNSVRYCTLDAVHAHLFFKVVPWDNLHGAPAPFVYAPDLIVPTYPFSIYEPGTTPDPPGCLILLYHTADADKHEEDLIPAAL